MYAVQVNPYNPNKRLLDYCKSKVRPSCLSCRYIMGQAWKSSIVSLRDIHSGWGRHAALRRPIEVSRTVPSLVHTLYVCTAELSGYSCKF